MKATPPLLKITIEQANELVACLRWAVHLAEIGARTEAKLEGPWIDSNAEGLEQCLAILEEIGRRNQTEVCHDRVLV